MACRWPADRSGAAVDPSVTPTRFTRETAVARRDVDRFDAHCHPGWRVFGGSAVNGGYLMAIGARAMAQRAERPDPVTLTGHFLAPPEVGPLEVVTEMVREGGRHRTVMARLLQDGRECVRLLGAFADLDRADGPTRVLREPPPWPPAETLSGPEAWLGESSPSEIYERLEHRMPPESSGWMVGAPTGEGINGGWCRWEDGRDIDTYGLLFVSDAYLPAVFDLGIAEIAWSPTIELTVQIRARPAPGWLATRFAARALTDGYFEEDGEIWDSSGRLVAMSRQLAIAGGPPKGAR
jgi:acyl-CoA thioesterase